MFLDQFNVKGLIVAGPGPTKETFLREEYLDYRLQNNIIAVLDTSYSGDEGVRETINKAQDQGVLTDYRLIEEKKIVNKFMSEVHSGKGLGIYGIFDVIRNLHNGLVDSVIVTDDITFMKAEIKCKVCGNVEEKIVDKPALITTKQEIISKPCPSCGGFDYEVIEKDIIDYLEELTAMSGSKLEVISSRTEEGAQLASLGRIGAMLRFRLTS